MPYSKFTISFKNEILRNFLRQVILSDDLSCHIYKVVLKNQATGLRCFTNVVYRGVISGEISFPGLDKTVLDLELDLTRPTSPPPISS